MKTNTFHSTTKRSAAKIIPFPLAPKKERRIKLWMIILIVLVLLFTGVMIYQTHKPLPAGISMEGPIHMVSDENIQFLSDLTYKDGSTGKTKQEQMIFDRIYRAIEEAEQFIVMDMFLYNGYYKTGQSFPPLSRTQTDKLIAAKAINPNISIVVITDQINTSYGSSPAPELERLRAAEIPIIMTNVDPLRDSSPLYSAGWRILAQWFGQSGRGWLPNPMAVRHRT